MTRIGPENGLPNPQRTDLAGAHRRLLRKSVRRLAVFLNTRPWLRAVVLREINRFPTVKRQLKKLLVQEEADNKGSAIPGIESGQVSRRTARVLNDLERAQRAKIDSVRPSA